ncbi:MAG: DUF6290 family protein [Fidelibacterota bacterium]
MSATTLRLPEEKLRALRVVSSLLNRPMSKIIEGLVDEFLEDYYDLKEAEEARKEEGTIPWEVVKKELGL